VVKYGTPVSVYPAIVLAKCKVYLGFYGLIVRQKQYSLQKEKTLRLSEAFGESNLLPPERPLGLLRLTHIPESMLAVILTRSVVLTGIKTASV
jgi:hypothetical protein